jgi:hypothetical protein
MGLAVPGWMSANLTREAPCFSKRTNSIYEPLAVNSSYDQWFGVQHMPKEHAMKHIVSLARAATALVILICAGCGETPQPEPPLSAIEWSSVDSIYNLKSKQTDLQKNERWKEFKGQKVRWTGKVSSVSESFGSLSLQVKMNPDTLTSDLLITLKDSQRSSATRLSKGDSVTFTGILDSWGTLLPTTLKEGEIAY